MKPDARVHAAIEVLSAILKGAAADRALQGWGRANRFAGSGDRRAIGELVYATLRSGTVPDDPRAAVLAGLRAQGHDGAAIDALFTGARHAPAPLSAAERAALDLPASALPDWLAVSLRRAYGERMNAELAALAMRAPLDLRVNTLKATRERALDVLAEEGIAADPLDRPDTALRVLAGGVDVESSAAHTMGYVEIQDAGSQLVAELADARADMSVLDLCAGAGGKTLALAAAMGNSGRLLACDTGAVRLKRLAPRAIRAGATIVETRLLAEDWLDQASPFTEAFDRVVIDAPCSGSGTWRRNPETRARLTQAGLAHLTALQGRLLDAAAPLVKPGGKLVYITCSILPEEDEDQADAFLARHAGFSRAAPDTRLSPASTATDGFFAAVFVRTPA
ncbi:Ribosomal RNA small subunit methyltransferase B [Alphaproteobacteria bacterium SO-S41]|nr:Ribosomal RNA small subunit methyltransferase B [Alphaproteobacteria bacterium SO-S41]